MIRRLVGSLLVVLFVGSCGGGGDSTVNPFSQALPSVAVSSPTAGTSSSHRAFLPNLFRVTEEKDVGKFPDQVNEIKNVASLPPAEAAAKVNFDIKGRPNTCFGQGKPYTNHVDGNGSGNTLSNDTGFDTDTETVDGKTVACPAATFNAKVAQLSGLVNEALKLAFVAAAQLLDQGKSLPEAEEASVEVTMPAVPNLTAATAKITKKANLGAYARYVTEMNGTLTTSRGSAPLSLTVDHAVNGADMKGFFRGSMPRGPEMYAFSMVYDITGGTAKFELRSSTTNGGATTVPSDMFNTSDLKVNFSPSGNRQDVNFMKLSVDTTTGLGSGIVAWNAGKTDPKARIFQVKTTSGSPDTGFAYYGFGIPINETNAATTLGDIEGMICAWSVGSAPFIGAGSGTALKTGKAQTMQMERDATSGEFKPVTGQVKIFYCPTNSCDGGGSMTYGGTACTAGNQLGTSTENGTISVSVPSYP